MGASARGQQPQPGWRRHGEGTAGPSNLAQKNGSRRRCALGVWGVCLLEGASELLICSPVYEEETYACSLSNRYELGIPSENEINNSATLSVNGSTKKGGAYTFRNEHRSIRAGSVWLSRPNICSYPALMHGVKLLQQC
jgi:hypothetical protein